VSYALEYKTARLKKQSDAEGGGSMKRHNIWIFTLIGIIIPFFVISCGSRKENTAPDTSVYTIADFEQIMDLRRWAIAGIAELSQEKVKSGSFALKVKLFQEEWPGIATTAFPNDISHYRILKFDIYSMSKSTLNLWVRIDDLTSVDSAEFKNRYNSLSKLHEGWNSIEIPLKGMKSSDGKRDMDLRKIQKFAIFLARPERDVVIYFDNIRIEK